MDHESGIVVRDRGVYNDDSMIVQSGIQEEPHRSILTTPRTSLERRNSDARSRIRKEKKERTRITRACDACKRKKIRCNGVLPCTTCVNAGWTCEYKTKYTRGKEPPTPQTAYEYATSHGSMDMKITGENEGDEGERTNIVPTGTSSRVSPEPAQTDSQGLLVGASSGASFFLRTRKRLGQNAQKSQTSNPSGFSSIFTFGDAPLPVFDASSFILPSKENALLLLDRYFSFAMPTYRFLHRQTVTTWLNDLYDNCIDDNSLEGSRERNAIIFMIFAIAQRSYPASSKDRSDSSVRYFLAAERQVNAETGPTRLASVQVRLCQCFYLISSSRINHCWNLFGTVARLVQAIGLHRRRGAMFTGISSMDQIEQECRKRTFWSAYILDRYLSAIFGRPCTFHPDDMDQELPKEIDDASASPLSPQSLGRRQTEMTGSIAHIRLVHIISKILKDFYGLSQISDSSRNALAKAHLIALDDWQSQLPTYLNPNLVEPSLLSLIYRRQSTMLSLSFYHARILVCRPFLLRDFASLRRRRLTSDAATMEFIDECVRSAMAIAKEVEQLCQGNTKYHALWFTQYVAFCAVVILYVRAIQLRIEGQNSHSWTSYLDCGEKCQRHLTLFATEHSLTERYTIVLEELRLEVTASRSPHLEHLKPQINVVQQRPDDILPQALSHVEEASTMFDRLNAPRMDAASLGDSSLDVGRIEHETDWSTFNPDVGFTPDSAMADFTSWTGFDSLVMAPEQDWGIQFNI